jgi:hypothetical protein
MVMAGLEPGHARELSAAKNDADAGLTAGQRAARSALPIRATDTHY